MEREDWKSLREMTWWKGERDAHAQDAKGGTPLMAAIQLFDGHDWTNMTVSDDLVNRLLADGADVNRTDDGQRNLLWYLNDIGQFIDRLVARGLDLQHTDETGASALHALLCGMTGFPSNLEHNVLALFSHGFVPDTHTGHGTGMDDLRQLQTMVDDGLLPEETGAWLEHFARVQAKGLEDGLPSAPSPAAKVRL